MADHTVLEHITMRQEALQREFDNNWKPHYQEIVKYVFPRAGRFLDIDTKPNDGKKRHQDIHDGTPIWGLRTLAAGMHTGLTSPVRPWFKFTLADKNRAKFKPVRLWLDEVRDIILAVLAKTYFYNLVHGQYSELGAFGTGAIQIDSDFKQMVRFYPFTIGEYYADTNQYGLVDTLGRTFKLQVRNVVAKFGLENVSPTAKNLYQNGTGQEWVKIHHIMEPNPDRILDKIDNGNMLYRSVYWEDGATKDKFLSSRGYKKKPFVVPRWAKYGSEVYGRGPGMDALGDIKQLHTMQAKGMKALAKMIDPPMNAPSSMKAVAATLIAGGVNYYQDFQGPNPGLTPVHQVNLPLRDLREEKLLTRQDVIKFFYADLFLLLHNDPQQKQVTAYEIAKRYEEKLMALGPVIERIQPEMLDEVIERVFDILVEADQIPPPPLDLEGQEVEIELISLLAQAQKMVAISGIEQVTTYVQSLAETHPEAVDMLDTDASISEYANSAGTASKIIRSEREVAQIREARAIEAQRQQEMAENAALAEGAETLSKADMSGNNALTQYLEAQGG